MLPFYKKYGKTFFDIGLIILTIYLFMWLFSFLFEIATPIFFGILFFIIIEPFAKFLNKKGIKKSLATTISSFSFILIFIGFATTVGVIITANIHTLVELIPKYIQSAEHFLIDKMDFLQSKIDTLPRDTVQKAEEQLANGLKQASTIISGFIVGTFTAISSSIKSISNIVIGFIVAYFLSLEAKQLREFFSNKTPKTFKNSFSFLRENVIKGIIGYIKAQLILIICTFIIVLIALLILQVNNAFTIAIFAAFFDILPLLGVTTLFLPWIIYLFIVKQTTLAIWLSVLLAIVVITRQILEPKIAGDSLGVSAFTMICFMIVSLSIFGVAGLIISPILIILIKALYEEGYLSKWISIPKDEFDYEDENEIIDNDGT